MQNTRELAKKVHVGCGDTAPEDWDNFDCSRTLFLERLPLAGILFRKVWIKNGKPFPANVRYGDIVRGLKNIPPGSCKAVYASHVLEHLPLTDMHRALQNILGVLRPGGEFRLVVPSLEHLAREYLARLDSGEKLANDYFMTESYLGRESNRRGISGLVWQALNTSSHLWMWDEPSMRMALVKTGFRNVTTFTYEDCKDTMFSDVAHPGRFADRAVALKAHRVE